MTKEEQNAIIKEAWVRNLREDIGDIYKNWVRNKIKQASAQLVQTQSTGGEQDQAQQPQQEAK